MLKAEEGVRIPLQPRTYGLWIDGREEPASSGRTFEVENPATREIIAIAAEGDETDVDRAVAAAQAAFPIWSGTPPAERFHILYRFAQKIRENSEELARWETMATGRPIREMRAQVLRLPDFYEYFAAVARTDAGELPTANPSSLNYTRYVPLGVAGLVTPWNHPLLILTKKLAPALAAGNTVVIKPSEYTPTSTIDLARLAQEAGIPDGVINVVNGFGATAGKRIATHPGIAKVDLTGGTETGKIVAGLASNHLAEVAMELGGKTPIIVCADADFEKTVPGLLFATFIAAGQSCVAGAKLLVHDSIYDKFVDEFVARTKQIQLGDPLIEETQMGPVASDRQYDRVLKYIETGKEEGATVACGGGPGSISSTNEGYFIAPTVLTDVTPNMTVAREEIFGPVAVIIRYKTEEEAIAIANDSPYGLGASVWTESVRRGHKLAMALETGVVWINDHHRIDPSMPWGGWKDSGVGTEVGLQAYRAFTKAQTVVVNLNTEKFDWYGGSSRYS